MSEWKCARNDRNSNFETQLAEKKSSRVVDTVTHLDLSTAGKFVLHRTSTCTVLVVQCFYRGCDTSIIVYGRSR